MLEAVLDAGGLPCFLSPGYHRESLDELEALIIPGGNDVDPAKYGHEADGTHMEEVQPSFDDFEIGLAREVLDRGMPFLGTCRGALLMNVASGGSLIQDLRADSTRVRREGGRLHTPLDHTCVKGLEQSLTVRPGTRLHQIAGPRLRVDSMHHQAVDRLADIFVPVAYSRDGVLEAYQHRQNKAVACYQFHPEQMREMDPRMQRLFEWLVEDALLYRRTRTGRSYAS